MSAMTNPAQALIDDIKAKVQSIAPFSGKTILNVYDVDDLLDSKVGVVFPCAGVIYEGIRSVADQGATMRQGMASEGVITIVLLYSDDQMGASAQRAKAILHLDLLRGAIGRTTSPAGHKWRFQVEAPAAKKGGRVMWVQRWTTPIMLN